MCNDYGNRIPYSAYVEVLGLIGLPVVAPEAAPNLEPRDDIWPTEPAPVLRRQNEGVEIAQVRWGFAPGRPKAGPVINFPNDQDYTRVTEFKYLTGQQHDRTTLVYEYSRADGDPHYPVPQPRNAALYRKYQELADATLADTTESSSPVS